MATVKQGARDPVALRVTISNTGVSSPVVSDFTTVTAGSVVVTDTFTGVSETWSTTILSQTTSTLVLEHRYQQSDTATLRRLHCYVSLTVTGAANAVLVDETFELEVTAR